MTIIMVAGTGPVTAAPFTVPAATPFVISLFTEVGIFLGPRDRVSLDMQNENGNWAMVGSLDAQRQVCYLPPLGPEVTYRLRRTMATVAIGADGR